MPFIFNRLVELHTMLKSTEKNLRNSLDDVKMVFIVASILGSIDLPLVRLDS